MDSTDPGEKYWALFVDTLVKTGVGKCDEPDVYSCVGGINHVLK